MKDEGINIGIVQKFDTSDRRMRGVFYGFRKMFWKYLAKLGVQFYDPCCPEASAALVIGSTETRTGAGAISTNVHDTLIVSTGANAMTLAAGREGQFKFIRMKTDAGDATVTVTNGQGFTTLTFNDAGDFVYLHYIDAKWHIVTNSGVTAA